MSSPKDAFTGKAGAEERTGRVYPALLAAGFVGFSAWMLATRPAPPEAFPSAPEGVVLSLAAPPESSAEQIAELSRRLSAAGVEFALCSSGPGRPSGYSTAAGPRPLPALCSDGAVGPGSSWKFVPRSDGGMDIYAEGPGKVPSEVVSWLGRIAQVAESDLRSRERFAQEVAQEESAAAAAAKDRLSGGLRLVVPVIGR